MCLCLRCAALPVGCVVQHGAGSGTTTVASQGREHNVKRAAAVLDKAELFLDAAVPLDSARWSDVTR